MHKGLKDWHVSSKHLPQLWSYLPTVVTPGPTFIKRDQLDPWIKAQLKITLLSTISSLQGQALPYDTKFRNCRGEIVDSRIFPNWSLIHGSSWSGLIREGPEYSCKIIFSISAYFRKSTEDTVTSGEQICQRKNLNGRNEHMPPVEEMGGVV